MPLDRSTIDRLREETPGCHRRIHLNNAGAGLMPQPVSKAIRDHLDLECERGGYEAADARAEAIESCYASVATLLGCHSRNIAFVENATVAYAQALSSIPFRPGDVIVTSINDYISNQIMFLSLQKRLGIEVRRAPEHEDGGIDAEATIRLLRESPPRLLALTHMPTNSGLVQPVDSIGEVCRELGVLFLLDSCQTVGQMPIDVASIGCDFLSATSRKFLRGPRGVGFLYVSDHALDSGYAPLYIDMRGADWTEANTYRVTETAKRFENWEFAYALILGTGAAADYALSIGLEAIRERAWSLAARARERLDAIEGVRVLDRGRTLGAIVTAQVDGWDSEAFFHELDDRGFNLTITRREYAVIDFDAKGVRWALRISPHAYNLESEIDAFADAIAELQSGPLGSRRR